MACKVGTWLLAWNIHNHWSFVLPANVLCTPSQVSIMLIARCGDTRRWVVKILGGLSSLGLSHALYLVRWTKFPGVSSVSSSGGLSQGSSPALRLSEYSISSALACFIPGPPGKCGGLQGRTASRSLEVPLTS